MTLRLAALCVCLFALSACASSPGAHADASDPGRQPQDGAQTGPGAPVEAPAGPPPEAGACAADAFQVLIGQPVGEVHQESLPMPHRIYERGDAVTLDHRPDRLNIVVGDGGTVVDVKCG